MKEIEINISDLENLAKQVANLLKIKVPEIKWVGKFSRLNYIEKIDQEHYVLNLSFDMPIDALETYIIFGIRIIWDDCKMNFRKDITDALSFAAGYKAYVLMRDIDYLPGDTFPKILTNEYISYVRSMILLFGNSKEQKNNWIADVTCKQIQTSFATQPIYKKIPGTQG